MENLNIKWENRKASKVGNGLAVFIPKELEEFFENQELILEWDGKKLIIYKR